MKEQNNETRWNILDAAMQHFSKFGYKGASISKIATEAGVSKSLVFWYFNTKESLFYSLVDRFVGYCISNLEKNNSSGNSRQKIEFLIDNYWSFIRKNFKFVRLFMNWFIQLTPKKKNKTQQLTNLHHAFQKLFERYLIEGIEQNLFRKDMDIHSTSLYIVSCLEGVLLQILINDLDIEQLNEVFLNNLKINVIEGFIKRN